MTDVWQQSNLPSPPDSAQAGTAQDLPVSSNDGGPPPLPRTRSNNRQRKTEPAALGSQSNNAQPMTQNATRHPPKQTNAAAGGGQNESTPFANSASNGQSMVNPMLCKSMLCYVLSVANISNSYADDANDADVWRLHGCWHGHECNERANESNP